MTRELAVLALSLASLALAGCGYVGEPLPPALNIPVSITDLSALQRGGQVYVRFTIPGLTTEQLPVTGLEEVELRAGANKVEPFDTNAWASGARRIDVTKLAPGEVIVTAAAREWVGSEVIVGARMRNRKGRWSGWSNLATLNVVEPAVTPAGVTAGSIPTGAKLSWQGPVGLKFRVFRDATLLGEVAANEYADATAEFGKEYVYQVIAMRGAAESEPTAPIRFTPADVFAPATPGGLTLIAGTRSAELAWERNTESDFKSYRVYRAEGDGAFAAIAAEIEAPAYSDRTAESGKKYKYAVTATDLSGNESPRCAPVEIAIP